MTRSLRFLLLAAAFGVAGGRAPADMVYLAVGDSSAFGETDRTRNPSNGDRGYVAPFADYLATRNGGVRPSVVNTAINGETTTSFFSGQLADRVSTDGITLNSNYAPFRPAYPSQESFVQSAITSQLAAGNTIGTVTVQLGANDLDALGSTPGFLGLSQAQQQALVVQALTLAGQNFARVLTDIRTLLPNADLFVIGYHNPYGGIPGHPLAAAADPALRGLNGVIEAVGTNPAFGGRYVDFYHVVRGREHELTLADRYPADLTNYVHLNDAGYAAVSQELIGQASVPAPPAVLLLGLGVVPLMLRRLRRAA